MGSGFLRRSQFLVERWVQRGVLFQLLFMSSLIATVAILGGVAAWALTPSFSHLPAAIWWSFLRLTDPGYLGDDQGTTLRAVSTVVTVLGYVLFMGSLIAIMSQWLAGTIRKLESGLTPISMANHFVVLGWTNRTPEIIKKLLTAGGRVERFFARRGGTRQLRVVVLANEVNAQRRLELRESLGEDWRENHVFLRSGSSLQQEHLERLDLLSAAVVVIPGADFELGGAELTDTRVIKTLLTLDKLFREGGEARTPQVVAELFDPRKVSIARSSIGATTEVIASDRLISRLLSQSLRHPGVATVLLKLLTHREGSSIYVRSFPELAGTSARGLAPCFPTAVVLGVVSMGAGTPTVHLNPGDEVKIAPDDMLILIAERYDQCQYHAKAARAEPLPTARALELVEEPERRLLILGWSYKIPTLIEELLQSGVGRFAITIMSRVGEEERQRVLKHIDVGERVQLDHIEGDYSLKQDLEAIEPHRFDHIVLLASGWMSSSEEADARTVLGVVLLRSLLREHGEHRQEILVELLDPDNARILDDGAEAVFVSPELLSHLLAHVALRHELNAVFEELIGADGAELDLVPAAALELSAEVTFTAAQEAADGFGCVALGFLSSEPGGASRVHLNPDRARRWHLGERDRVIVLRP